MDWTSLSAVIVDGSGALDITLAGGLDETSGIKLGGDIDLNVLDTVLATGSFQLTTKTLDINDGTNEIVGAEVLIFNLSDVSFFAGIDGSFNGVETASDGTKATGIDNSQGTGFVANNGGFANTAARGAAVRTGGGVGSTVAKVAGALILGGIIYNAADDNNSSSSSSGGSTGGGSTGGGDDK
jgi:hypothetical protein